MQQQQQQQQPTNTASTTTTTTPPPLVTLVSYCSYERAFIRDVVANARRFSSLVVVAIGSRLYTGHPEDVDTESRIILDAAASDTAVADDAAACPLVVVAYDVPDHLLAHPIALHNRARSAALEAARQHLGFAVPFWTLLLDADEIPDGRRFDIWWRSPVGGAGLYADTLVAHKLANYWAFLHPHLVSAQHEDSVLLVHSDLLLNPQALEHPRERDGIYLWHWASPLGRGAALRLNRMVLGLDGNPLFSHLSWVRYGRAVDMPTPSSASSSHLVDPALAASADALKLKCAAWGHCNDRHDWAQLIDHAVHDATVEHVWPDRDFVHGHPLVVLSHK